MVESKYRQHLPKKLNANTSNLVSNQPLSHCSSLHLFTYVFSAFESPSFNPYHLAQLTPPHPRHQTRWSGTLFPYTPAFNFSTPHTIYQDINRIHCFSTFIRQILNFWFNDIFLVLFTRDHKSSNNKKWLVEVILWNCMNW